MNQRRQRIKRQGTAIKLIEKKGKDKMHIKNWRPISLLNVDAKIASKALAKRLETVLPLIIHENQCAYVKGRSIFDCTRIIDDIMFYTKENNLSGLLLAIDFEKAFDSLDWTFLNKALSAFNFNHLQNGSICSMAISKAAS